MTVIVTMTTRKGLLCTHLEMDGCAHSMFSKFGHLHEQLLCVMVGLHMSTCLLCMCTLCVCTASYVHSSRANCMESSGRPMIHRYDTYEVVREKVRSTKLGNPRYLTAYLRPTRCDSEVIFSSHYQREFSVVLIPVAQSSN